MPELPEVEIAARRLGSALAGAEVESVLTPGMVAMKTFDPPVSSLEGREIERRRRGSERCSMVRSLGGDRGGSALLVHLMSAGRLQVFDKRASLKDRRSRILIRLAGGRELRLREFGTKQRAWAKLLRIGGGGRRRDGRDARTRGMAGPVDRGSSRRDLRAAPAPSAASRPTPIAGIGRSWVDEVLWEAKLAPFRKGADLDAEETERLRDAMHVLGDAIDHYEEVIGETVPDKLPMPLRVHRREGEPCPRCGTTIEAVYFAEHQTNYCPACQTGGRVLKDRRLSRLLK